VQTLASSFCCLKLTKKLSGFWVHKILLSIFGLGCVFNGVFHHAPIIEGIIYNSTKDNLHSNFASIVGFSFTVYEISSAFIEKDVKNKVIDIIVGVTATILSMLMSYMTEGDHTYFFYLVDFYA